MTRRRVPPVPPQQRSLFDDEAWPPPVRPEPAASPGAAGPATPAPAMPPSVALVPGPPAGVRAPSPEPLDRALAPVELRHPEADREIALDGHRVGYVLRRVRRNSIGFIVGPEGLAVHAPRWVGLREIEAGLREKGPWILKKLGEQQARAHRRLAARVTWGDGASFPFLGETVIVVLDPRAGAAPGGAILDAAAETLPGVARLTLHVGLAHDARPEQIRDAVQSWLQRQARRIFEERCRIYAAALAVRWTRLSLSSAQTRWGSAHASGAIRLNWRLVHFALPTIDYVVAHELAHLREMNHGPRFWDVVRSVLPDYQRARRALKDDALPAFD
jgi:predicted metal-dependent hydrolase